MTEGPERCLEASTRSSLREERQRANTDSPREGEGGRERSINLKETQYLYDVLYSGKFSREKTFTNW